MRRTWIAIAIVVGVLVVGGAMLIAAFAGLAAGTALAAPAGENERYVSGEGTDKIVIIPIAGVIARQSSADPLLGQTTASSKRIARQLDRARDDAAVKAVILELDTPGGSVVASDEVLQKVQTLRDAGKPVIALMTETAASGGYYIASGADHIIADASTITGSIGVIVSLVNTEELYEKIGVEQVVYKSGEFKDIGSATRPVTPQEEAIFQQLVDESYNRFVDVVAEGRALDRDRVLQIADGRIYTGRQALDLGLVDQLGHLPDAIEVAKEKAGLTQARVVEYGSGGLFASLLDGTAIRLQHWLVGPADVYRALHQPLRTQYLLLP